VIINNFGILPRSKVILAVAFLKSTTVWSVTCYCSSLL
jgi:hypothetical protein